MSLSISTPEISSMHRSRLTSDASLDRAREADLVSRIRGGDPGAFESLVGHYGPRMLAVARRLLRCEEDSADAVQEAFLAAHKSIAYFAGHSSLWTWLYRIVVNISLKKMYSRSRRREVPLDNVLAASGRPGRYAPLTARWNETADVCAARAEMQTQVRSCINCLQESYRTILFVRDIQELDTDEAARLLHLSPGAVKSRLHRARRALTSLLRPIVGFEEAGRGELRRQSGSFGNICPDDQVYAGERERTALICDSRAGKKRLTMRPLVAGRAGSCITPSNSTRESGPTLKSPAKRTWSRFSSNPGDACERRSSLTWSSRAMASRR